MRVSNRVGTSPLDAAALWPQERLQAIQMAFAWVHQAAHLLAKGEAPPRSPTTS